jgi:thiol-disulfide isomerase/thioredoxin
MTEEKQSPPTQSGFRGGAALRGSLEGALVVGLSFLLGLGLANKKFEPLLGCFGALVGAVMFGCGRGIAGGVGGASVLGILGMGLGAIAGERWIGQISYQETAVFQPGEEIEITGPTLSGDTFDLRSLRGKVVLVDFWATWCGPCIAEHPNILAAYERHHNAGFEVVGVSLDQSREALSNFVQKHKIPWPQIFFPETADQGWKNPLARKYGINSIPTLFLVNREGRIVAANEELRGTRLEPAVAALLSGTGDASGATPSGVRWVRPAFFPMGLVLGATAGCILGSLAGAFAERALRRRLASTASAEDRAGSDTTNPVNPLAAP